MPRRVPPLLLVAAGLASSGGMFAFWYFSFADRPLTGPPTHFWADFPVGAWVSKREVVGEQTSIIREELIEVGPETVRIRVATEIGGKTETEPLSIGRRDEEWSREGFTAGPVEAVPTPVRTFRARRYEREGETRWFSDALPAWPVRIVKRDPDGTVMETRVARVGERRNVGNAEVECIVFEETRTWRGQEVSRYLEWRSQTVPGHLVARRGLKDGFQIVHEATGFGRAP